MLHTRYLAAVVVTQGVAMSALLCYALCDAVELSKQCASLQRRVLCIKLAYTLLNKLLILYVIRQVKPMALKCSAWLKQLVRQLQQLQKPLDKPLDKLFQRSETLCETELWTAGQMLRYTVYT
jgi:hypothetical protein